MGLDDGERNLPTDRIANLNLCIRFLILLAFLGKWLEHMMYRGDRRVAFGFEV